ncbi:SIR2 family protein [[Clostridium] spiroforme]|nr:SIR2 family protein [Thomasclavelia spiroformis]
MNIKSQAIKNLVEAMNDDELIIFVGAGVSANSGLPSWSKLIKELKKELSLEDDVNDYLKIAQIYYNKWGRQKYIQKINSIFYNFSDAVPNTIHREILKIQPAHIITTNYDNLLEDILYKSVRTYDVVKKNEDIPYIKSKHYLIKMHGDLQEQNIVLKEDDYSDYNENYYMIATLIKALIMNHTLLFIGYSLNDSTFNSIFRIIQNFYGENAKKSYFYDANIQSEEIVDYYRKKGIHVISEENKNGKIETNELGEYTTKFLRLIADRKDNIVKNGNDIYHNLSFLKKMKFVEAEDIVIYSGLLGKIFKIFPDEISDNFQKSNIIKITEDDKKLIDFLKHKTLINNFLKFKIDSINNISSNQVQKEAFSLYEQKKYEMASDKFRDLANKCYERKDYFNFLLAKFNYNNIKNISYPGDDTDKNDQNLTDFDLLDNNEIIDKIINNGNRNEKRIALYFRDIVFSYKFLYRKLETIDRLYDELKKEHYNFLQGGSSVNNNLLKLKLEIRSLKQYVEANCICVSHISIYKEIMNRYFECLLLAHDNSYYPKTRIYGMEYTSSIEKQINLEDIQIIIDHVDIKLVRANMNNSSFNKIKITDEDYDKIVDLILNNAKENDFLCHKYIRFLTIVKVDNVNSLLRLLENIDITHNDINDYNSLIIELILNIQTANDDIKNKVLNIIVNNISRVLNNNNLINKYARVFPLYEQLLKKIDINETIKFEILERTLIVINNSKNGLEEIEIYKVFITSFYDYFDDKDKRLIKTILKKYENRFYKDRQGDREFIYAMIQKKIYRFNKVKDLIFEELINIINDRKRNGHLIDSREQAAINLFNLYICGYFKIEKIQKSNVDLSDLKGKIPELDWMWFNKKDEETISRLLKHRKFENAKKIFCKTKMEEKMFDNWLIKKYEMNKVWS